MLAPPLRDFSAGDTGGSKAAIWRARRGISAGEYPEAEAVPGDTLRAILRQKAGADAGGSTAEAGAILRQFIPAGGGTWDTLRKEREFFYTFRKSAESRL